MEVCKDKIERLRVDGSGKLVAGIPENIPRTNVEKILNILLKGQDMRRQLQRCGEKKNPDYLWLLSEDKELLKNICGIFEKKQLWLNWAMIVKEKESLFTDCREGIKGAN